MRSTSHFKDIEIAIRNATEPAEIKYYRNLSTLLHRFANNAHVKEGWSLEVQKLEYTAFWDTRTGYDCEYYSMADGFDNLSRNKKIDSIITEAKKLIKDSLKDNLFYLMPIYTSDESQGACIKALEGTFKILPPFGKKDASTFNEIAKAYLSELLPYNLYSIKYALRKIISSESTCKTFPNIIELKKTIEYKNKMSLKILANANFVLQMQVDKQGN